MTLLLLGELLLIRDHQNPFLTGLLVLFCVACWKFLLAPWRSDIRAIMLASFLSWLLIDFLVVHTWLQCMGYGIAVSLSLLPVIILEHSFRSDDCDPWLYHLMLFAGAFATLPLVLYSFMVKHNIEVNVFLLRIIPTDVFGSSDALVSERGVGVFSLEATLSASFIAFVVAATIEESCKYIVLRHAGHRAFGSVRSIMSCAIAVAIGFTFAENILNPYYFPSFVETHLINPAVPEWITFMRKVGGRAILSTMAHVIASGIGAYFIGLVLSTDIVAIRSRFARLGMSAAALLERMFGLPRKLFFRYEMLTVGLVSAIALHTLFNVTITLPHMVPKFLSLIPALSFVQGISLSTVSITLSVLLLTVSMLLLIHLFHFSETLERKKRVLDETM